VLDRGLPNRDDFHDETLPAENSKTAHFWLCVKTRSGVAF
jgi:hypothetical protein